ncbi:Cytochrome c [Granulibacter bethesdensis CGDNIH4]|nr:Cytochrome c [Granulibacter bethesdensis CGDNIH4]
MGGKNGFVRGGPGMKSVMIWAVVFGAAALTLAGWCLLPAMWGDETPVPVPSIALLMASADPAKGEVAAERHCHRCHALTGSPDARTVAPPLRGVIGRERASVPGFHYSHALKEMHGQWDTDSLNAWLFRPSAFAPGTRMSFAGVKDDRERADIIAYLRVISGLPPASIRQSGQP